MAKGLILNLLYLLHARDSHNFQHSTLATFGDDTEILAIENDLKEANKTLPKYVDTWTKRWKIRKFNEGRSVHITSLINNVNVLIK